MTIFAKIYKYWYDVRVKQLIKKSSFIICLMKTGNHPYYLCLEECTPNKLVFKNEFGVVYYG